MSYFEIHWETELSHVFDYYVLDSSLSVVETTRNFGIWFSSDLSFDIHIGMI